jgi:AbrB family looped-hinge helix DNA binding protein
METSVLTSKYQVVIPKNIRRKYDFKAGVRVVFQETKDGVIIKPLGKDHYTRFKGILPRQTGNKKESVWDWKKEMKEEEEKIMNRKLNLLSEPEVPYKKTVKPIRKKK